jgi:diaminopimelate decarboxylase
MANNYNAALKPPVIFCENGAARVAVRRETFEDLLAREIS